MAMLIRILTFWPALAGFAVTGARSAHLGRIGRAFRGWRPHLAPGL